MNDIRKALLDEFGEKLILEVRDNACEFVQRVISGKMRDKTSATQFQLYRSIDSHAAEVLQRFLMIAIDACLVQFLHFIDSNEIDVIVSSSNDLRVEIRSLSDGLVGEVHNEDGWIARFSSFKGSIEPIA